ncbi:MAG: Glycosyl transferases group 1 [Synergistetes bacterium ADurb.Bin155]|jgi:glycosyltransferase involved in cell wall biosynthesis|nr:glycosyltransferase family 4 protein [Synergistales bacterium]MBP8996185.1 glycosyltransferase family 4 protein [Synergistales bacterium]OQB46445.1 MAG: Glycosyl transferases group 1 [Synergistetes bacterium ADurb.Bin155]HQL02049.1 glycosyltransferase [Synergistales bacterium]
MKVVFLYVGGFSPQHLGVWQKILSQHNALCEKGISSWLLLINEDGSTLYDGPLELSKSLPISSNSLSFSRLRKLTQKKVIYEKALLQIRKLNPDIVYLRYPAGDPFFGFFLNEIEKPVITEHQTNEIKELLSNRDWPKFFFEKTIGPITKSRTSGMVCVTNEIARDQSAILAKVTKKLIPIRVISNGISLKHSPVRRKAPIFDREMNLIFVGNISKWHGLDSIIKSIAKYNGPKKISFNIVGAGKNNQRLKEISKRLDIEDAIRFWEPRSPRALDSFFDNAHLGVGSFGRHRTGMSEGCALKLREYCVRGIPFIDGTIDPDFPPTFPFGMHLQPNKDGYINLAQVVTFVESLYFNFEPLAMVKEIRSFAEEKLDWNIKIEKLIHFFNEIIGGLEK